MRNATIDHLERIAQADPRVMLLVGDLGYGVVEGFAQRLPRQFLNMGVAEQNMIGVAAGLAHTGRRVFVYSIANFATLRGLEQFRNDVCHHGLPVTVIAVGGGLAYGNLGPSHHGTEDLAAMAGLPGARAFVPADRHECRWALARIEAEPGPTYLRLARNGEPDLHRAALDPTHDGPFCLREGDELCFVAAGPVAEAACGAADHLAQAGIRAAVYSHPHLRYLPARSFSRHRIVVAVEEHVEFGGLGSRIAAGLAADASPDRPRLVHACLRFAGDVHPFTVGDQGHLRRLHGLEPQSLAALARQALDENAAAA